MHFSHWGGPTYLLKTEIKKISISLICGGSQMLKSSNLLKHPNLHFSHWGPQKLKIFKSSKTSKSAFFSFGGRGVQHISLENRDKKISIVLICGASQKLKILKSSETSKSIWFSSVGGPTYIF